MADAADLDMDLDLAAMRRRAEEGPSTEAPPVGREQAIAVRYTSPDGESFQASLTSRVLDAKGKLIFDRMVGHMVAQRGVSWQYLAPVTQMEIAARARVVAQLVEPPEWVTTWAHVDNDLLFPLAGALEVHEARYFRRDSAQGPADAREPRVVVDSVDAPRSASGR